MKKVDDDASKGRAQLAQRMRAAISHATGNIEHETSSETLPDATLNPEQSQEFDLAGAQATKIDFIAVTYGFGFKNKTELGKYNPVFVVTKPSDLTDYFYR